ncbi:MAG: hypothetical protein IH628_16600, partial [Proteobacteria bacterium]|nr:hypothetical protein [Pseudomonadota bacterium]
MKNLFSIWPVGIVISGAMLLGGCYTQLATVEEPVYNPPVVYQDATGDTVYVAEPQDDPVYVAARTNFYFGFDYYYPWYYGFSWGIGWGYPSYVWDPYYWGGGPWYAWYPRYGWYPPSYYSPYYGGWCGYYPPPYYPMPLDDHYAYYPSSRVRGSGYVRTADARGTYGYGRALDPRTNEVAKSTRASSVRGTAATRSTATGAVSTSRSGQVTSSRSRSTAA